MKKPIEKQHKHKWVIWTNSTKTTGLRCKDKECTARRERPATKTEVKRFLASHKKMQDECDKQNRIAHEFDKKFKRYKKGEKIKIGGRYYRERIEDGWKWEGYDLMEKVGEWAKKYPDDVMIAGIDDTHFTSSDVVFILHRPSPKRLWGTSVIVITQCDGKPPKEFFMYPSHSDGIKRVMDWIGRLDHKFKD